MGTTNFDAGGKRPGEVGHPPVLNVVKQKDQESMTTELCEEIKNSWRKFKSKSRVRRIALTLPGILFVLLSGWQWWLSAQQRQMELLYNSAFTGNLESVRRLSTYRLSGGATWLEKLARDRYADADSRVAAIDELM